MSCFWIIIYVGLFGITDLYVISSEVPGIKILTRNSGVCSEVSLEDIDNFTLCSFIRLKNQTKVEFDNTLFQLQDHKNTFQIMYGNFGHFSIIYNNYSHVYPKMLDFDEWTKICITGIENEIELEVNYRITRKISQDQIRLGNGSNRKLLNKEILNQHNITELESNMRKSSICIGKFDSSKSSIIGSIAGITLQRKTKNVTPMEDFCILEDNFHSYLKDFEHKKGMVKRAPFNLSELCWGPHIFLLLKDTSYYVEHVQRCQSLNGRLILYTEIVKFSKKLKIQYLKKTTYKRQTDDQINTVTWLHDGNEENERVGLCPAYNLKEGFFLRIPCKVELEYNFCVLSKYSDFTLYGSLSKYDRHYTLQSKNESIILKGESSIAEWQDHYWILRSVFHRDFLRLFNATVPVGRNSWKNYDQVNKYLLTFTYCKSNQFTCTVGDCIPSESRCNGTYECSDASDEEECVLITKKRGYKKTKIPPPKKGESEFHILYNVGLTSISNISPIDGIVKVGVTLSLYWFEPRITFNTHSPYGDVDCKEIWYPRMYIADVNMESLTVQILDKFCHFISTESLGMIERNHNNDPFMGRHIDGNDMELKFSLNSLVTVPCNLNLRKYPFGIQNCSFRVWLKGNLDDNYLDDKFYQVESLNYGSTQLIYEGRANLGEFHFLSATHRLDANNQSVTVTLCLQTLFGFHVINSFIPSFLICLISYSTLFFNSDYFNERIMVSLTALLVLTTLTSQANNASVRTSYFKYLDIWFVALISFCFFIVTGNVLIHKMEIYRRKILKKSTLFDDDLKNEDSKSDGTSISEDFGIEKVKRFDTFLEVSFAALLTLFVVLFSLGAAEFI